MKCKKSIDLTFLIDVALDICVAVTMGFRFHDLWIGAVTYIVLRRLSAIKCQGDK